MQEDFPELQALLRLKRYEMPPPDYYEDFLLEFHQRQRAELLRRPLWRIALDRLNNFIPELPALPVPHLAYAGAAAFAVLAAGGMVSRQMSTGGPGLAARQPTAPMAATALAANVTTAPRAESLFAPSLAVSLAEADDALAPVEERARALRFARSAAMLNNPASAYPTRYLLETQPVRYEPRSTSF